LTMTRLERAKELLAAHESSIADIALQCGFSTQGTFTKAFVRSLSISPGRYRRTCASLVSAHAGAGFMASTSFFGDSTAEMLSCSIPAV
jgi:AraC-like DNA-binding protein